MTELTEDEIKDLLNRLSDQLFIQHITKGKTTQDVPVDLVEFRMVCQMALAYITLKAKYDKVVKLIRNSKKEYAPHTFGENPAICNQKKGWNDALDALENALKKEQG